MRMTGHWVGVSHQVSLRVLPQQERPWCCQSRAADMPAVSRQLLSPCPPGSPGRIPPTGTHRGGSSVRAAPGPGPSPALGRSPSKKPTAAGNSANVKLKSLGISQTAVLRGKLFLVAFPSVAVQLFPPRASNMGVSLHMDMAGVQHTAWAWCGSLQTRELPQKHSQKPPFWERNG